MNADQMLERAWTLRQAGQIREAEEICHKIVATQPENFMAHFALAVLAQQRNDTTTAIERLTKALVFQPSYPLAIALMAELMLLIGQSQQAIHYGEKRLLLSPNDPNALDLVGRAYYTNGQLLLALQSFQRATILSPNESMFHFAAGSILSELARDDEASVSLRKAVLFSPTVEALTSLSSVELKLGFTEEALKFANRAVKKDKTSAQAYVALAQAQMETRATEAAEGNWQLASELSSDPAFVLNQRARSLIRLGDFELAIQHLTQAIELKPDQGFPYYAITASKKISESDRPLIRKMEGLLKNESLSSADRRYLHYALGKSYDNLGKYETAICHFDEANALNPQELQGQLPFDKSEFAALVNLRKSIFTQNVLATQSPYRNPSSQPIFVVGMMRCGTTLAEQILSCHPLVGGAGEQAFWVQAEPRCVDFSRKKFDLNEISRQSAAYLGILSRAATGFPCVVDKNPANIMATGLIHLAFPYAKIIHIKRHPVDVALSIWMTPMDTSAKFAGNRKNIVFAYKETMRLAKHWQEVISPLQYLEVGYEDLVNNPEVNTRKMLDFCDLPWDETCLYPQKNGRAVKTPSFWQVRQPIYRTSMERWRCYEPWLGPFTDLMP